MRITTIDAALLEVICFLLLSAVVCGALLWGSIVRAAHRTAMASYESWRERDLVQVRHDIERAERQNALSKLQEWKIETEVAIRQDALARSAYVTIGKVSEHIAPYMPDFPYNPKDARFIGSPIDLLVFDGCDEGFVQQVVFLEIKSGNSRMSPRQKQVRDAVLEGRVVWREMRI